MLLLTLVFAIWLYEVREIPKDQLPSPQTTNVPAQPIPANQETKPQQEASTNPGNKQHSKHLPEVATGSDKSPAIGSITQGSGSIAQVGGTGNQATVNNFGAPPLPTPTVKVCLHPQVLEGQQYSTPITIKTDVQITRPWLMFFFDGPVDNGTFTMDSHTFGCNCPMRADKLPNPERSMGFKLVSIDESSNIWFPFNGAIRVSIPSKTPVKLVNLFSGGGDDPSAVLPEHVVYQCD